jgi:hypothetical protein
MSRLTRRDDWASRLMATVEAERSRPFVWGTADCCLFVADCILAMTGVDPAAAFRGFYHSAHGARRCLKNYCGGGLEALAEQIAAEQRLPEILPTMAQRGDAVLLEAYERPPEYRALGICLGASIAAQGPQGLSLEPMSRALRAWRI